MKKKIFIAAAVIFSSHLHAQDMQAQQDSSNKTLDEVIVTANKFSQKQSETGKSSYDNYTGSIKKKVLVNLFPKF